MVFGRIKENEILKSVAITTDHTAPGCYSEIGIDLHLKLTHWRWGCGQIYLIINN